MIRYYSKLLTFRVEKSYGTRYMSMQYMLVNLFCVFCALCLRGFNNICEHEAYSWRFYGVRSRSSFFFSFSKRMKKIFPSILSHARKFIGYVILDFLSPFFLSYLSKLRGLKMWIKIEFQTTWERYIFEIRRWNQYATLISLCQKIVSPKFTNCSKARRGKARENSFKKEMKRSFFQNKDRYTEGVGRGEGEEGWF